ncbi:hypothetical protein UCRPA7_1605 [Phaeoacremonium minimum UCRPA7]|uniref:Uncharacterized protein n=1 Tax=Phaeoacremonium minimum (strain UCR-PA7) TaxID=1286976 RepID=R8BU21_PHAM7|nr:hypothetical protein UCRPA7_1605 [Phaeoacremonium minimum UCRPA7]EOO02872.1 hypothetical protein UCRPA7_1605 [Phaeoacremonium minimum UCRPA7]
MPPVQKTFDLIPNILGSGLGRPGLAHDAAPHGPPAKPPMTSKQAKKLYKQANKAPKLSKAEQRRIELMEQDRIRKELEKEKAQARTRVARDRKKAKEEAQREAKKRKGLPLVDVRPSQDTIARFVRGNGTSKKRDSTGVELQPQSCLRTVDEGEEANDPPDKENEEPRPSPESRQPSNSLGPIAVPAVSEQSLDMMKSQNGASTVLEDAMSVQLEDTPIEVLRRPH